MNTNSPVHSDFIRSFSIDLPVVILCLIAAAIIALALLANKGKK